MAADNDLEHYVAQDLEEMRENPSWIEVFVMVDYETNSDTLYRVESETVPLETFDEIDSGDPQTLSSFLNEYRRDDLSFLVIWNHGDWWRGEAQTTTKGVAYDETNEDFLSVKEIKSVLKDSPVTVLGFDACLMGTFEILWELKECARYIVTSSKEIPAEGWDYTALKESTGLFSLLSRIVQKYHESYGESVSLSVWDTLKLDDVMYWLNRVSQYMMKKQISPWNFTVERRKIGGFSTELIELGRFARALSMSSSSDNTLRYYGEKLYDAIVSARIYGTPKDNTDLLLYLPENMKNSEYWDDFFALSDFTKDSFWDDLLLYWRDKN
ncbi:clostripain-related cysteine peptidase [Thermotoga sp. SG1]|uniref:clostripain-related cysteine peptidase n=1 Tax=Thermotoga sp. SG1 TaxID=126739 RepID=UPI000C76D954|nr:clostripain-related cysteine peptidase [Thermotoga sp. SG1]